MKFFLYIVTLCVAFTAANDSDDDDHECPRERNGCLGQNDVNHILHNWPRLFDTEDAGWLINNINCTVAEDFVSNDEGRMYFGLSMSFLVENARKADMVRKVSRTMVSTFPHAPTSSTKILLISNSKPGTQVLEASTQKSRNSMIAITLHSGGCITDLRLGAPNGECKIDWHFDVVGTESLTSK